MGRVACHWIQNNLAVPDGPLYGQPLRLSRRQVQLICDAFTFEVTDRGFDRVYDRVIYVGPKGEGKSPIAAMLAAFVAVGPSDPYDVHPDGYLLGRRDPSALVQIFANSERQGKRTTWKPLTAMLKNGRLSDDVFIGKTFIEFGDSYIHYEASSADSAEGPRVNLAVTEEIQYWRDRDMKNLWETIVRNLGKKDGFAFGPTNAPARGGGSVADEEIRASEGGGDDAESLLVMYPKAERIEVIRGPENKPEVMEALRTVYGESADPDTGWVNLDRVYKKLISGKEGRGRRYYLNESAEDEGKLVDSDRFDELERTGQKIPDGQFVALGFDGSEAEDATALVAVSCTEPPHVETVGVWKKPDGVDKKNWRIPKAEVRAALELCRERWKVEILVGDPSIAWKSFFTDFAEDWGEVQPSNVGDRSKREGWGLVCEIWMNNSPKITHAVVSHFIGLLDGEQDIDDEDDVPADDMVFDEITFTHDGDPELVAHTKAMVKATSKNGRFASVGKESEEDIARIDCGVALMLGLWGAAQFHARGDELVASGSGGGVADRLKGGSGGGTQEQMKNRLLGR